MPVGLVGKKCGMTRIFTEEGASVPISVVEVLPNMVSQVKSIERDGYVAIQVTTGSKKSSRLSKPLSGHFAKAGVEAGRGVWEFRIDSDEKIDVSAGSELNTTVFTAGQKIDVTGVTKGKGFAGAVKRHNFSMQRATHGCSKAHRAPGSIGQNQTPGRVFKGKKMAGHMGNVNRTIQNLEVIRVDSEKNILLIKGSIPGAPGGNVIIRPAVKKQLLGGNDGA